MTWLRDNLLAISILVLAASILVWTFHPARDNGRYAVRYNEGGVMDGLPSGSPVPALAGALLGW